MDGFKSLIQSKTFWSNAIGIISLLVPPASEYLAGIDPGATAEAASNGVALVMFVLSTWSRVTATKRIG